MIAPEPEDDPIVFWGPRHAENTCKHLLALVMRGRYKIEENTSTEMKKLIGDIQNRNGKAFTNQVKKWFEGNTGWLVYSEVPISLKGSLKSEGDLGDIDVLVIDKLNQRILSIECKNINHGRNPREIANEIKKLIGKDKDSNSWIQKHLKRDTWLKDNSSILSDVYEVPPDSFEICSFVLTTEEIPSTFVCTMILPVISFTRLQREGVRIFDNF